MKAISGVDSLMSLEGRISSLTPSQTETRGLMIQRWPFLQFWQWSFLRRVGYQSACTDSSGGRISADLLQTKHLSRLNITALLPGTTKKKRNLHTSSFKLHSHIPFQRSILRDNDPIWSFVLDCNWGAEGDTIRIIRFQYFEDGGRESWSRDPELREVFVLPDVQGGGRIEEVSAVKEGADAAGCGLYFYRAGGV